MEVWGLEMEGETFKGERGTRGEHTRVGNTC